MAVYGSLVSNVWRAYANATVSNTSNTVCTVTCTAGINIPTSGYETHRSFRATAYISGTSYSGSGTRADQQYTGVTTVGIASKSQTFTRTHSAYTVNYHGYLATPSGGSVKYSSTTSYGSVTIPARPSYSVSYNANGGSGAPGSSTKWYDETLTLSTTIPTRTGYSFLGWSTSSTATTATYAAGGSYTANAAATLFAVWKADTYAVTYNSNGGSGTISSDTKTYGINLTLSDGSGFTRTNHSLVKWNTASDGSGTDYALGGTYTGNAALNLYAQWHLDYIQPVISNFSAYRVLDGSSSTPSNEGEYIRITFSYTGGSIDGGNSYITPINCRITITPLDGNGSSTTDTITFSDSTGTPIRYYGTYSKDSAWAVTVELYDTYNVSTSVTTTISTATYPIDLYGSGLNVYMGIMHNYQEYQKLTLPDTHIDGDVIFILNDTETGTDLDILTLLSDLGWDDCIVQ